MAERPDDVDQRIWQEALDWLFKVDRQPADPAVAASLQAWLSQDVAHARAYEQARLIWDLSPHVPPAFADRWQEHGAATLPRTRRAMLQHAPVQRRRPAFAISRSRISRRKLVGGALAAGAALLVVDGVWTDFRADHVSAVGATKLVTLADGSRAHLDTDTAIRVAYGPTDRHVELLRGQAFFDVTRDEARRFVVTARSARIEVLGTRFDARLDRSTLRVAVEAGQVAVGVDGRDVLAGGPLASGDSVRVDLTTGIAQQGRTQPENIAAWRRGQLIVDRWTVAQVLDEIGRYHRGHILLRDDVLGARTVNGVYNLTRPVEAVRAVAEAFGGRVTALTSYLLIVSGR